MEYIKIGHITGTHGLDGKLNVSYEGAFESYLSPKKFIFVEIRKASYIPYEIIHIQYHGDQAIVQLDEFDSIELAKTISGKKLYLHYTQVHEEDLQHDKDYFIGFAILDTHLGKIGEIESMLELPGQLLAIVQYQNQEVMIPINEDFILEIKAKKKEIWMQLPDGLLHV